MEALDNITKALLWRYSIPYQDRPDVAQAIALGWVEGSKRNTDIGYLHNCCKYKVIDWLRKEFGWSKRIHLDEPVNEDGGTLMDTLCDHRATPYQAFNMKQQMVVESEISEQLAEYKAQHKPFGMMQLKRL